MEIQIDKSVVGEELGAARPVEVPATRYRQGGRDMFHMSVSLAELPRIVVKRPDPDHPIEGNRRVEAKRAQKFADYLVNSSEWVSPAIIVRAPSGDVTFDPAHAFPDGTAWGVLKIPLDVLSEILLLDGQHRTLGAFLAIDEVNRSIRAKVDAIDAATSNGNDEIIPELKGSLAALRARRERFTQEHISVDVVITTTDRAKQMFADINNNAKGVNPDYTTILDQRSVINRIAVQLMDEHPLLIDRVEHGQSTRMSTNNPNLIGAKAVSDIVRTVLLGISGRVGARKEEEISQKQSDSMKEVSTFLDVLVAGFEDLQAVIDGAIEPVDLRSEGSENRSMIGSATMLRAIAGAYYELTLLPEGGAAPLLNRAEVEEFFRELAPRLREIPIDENNRFWLQTEAFIPGTSAPQARQGTLNALVRSLVTWARTGF